VVIVVVLLTARAVRVTGIVSIVAKQGVVQQGAREACGTTACC
jgi:hypothetical protein